jgi:hypothetical protein
MQSKFTIKNLKISCKRRRYKNEKPATEKEPKMVE